jgi:uncharacterized protein
MPRELDWNGRSRWWVALFWLGVLTGIMPAGEVIPPAPQAYFNDYAQVTSGDTASRMNSALEQFEKDTSIQLVVAVYPKLTTDSAMEDFTVRVFQAWKVGQKSKNNGAVLFVFTQDRKVRIETGYGLEGALPDILCKRVIEEQITPHFRQGDYNGGLVAGTMALMQAAKGEYKGTGITAGESHRQKGFLWPFLVFLFVFIAIAILGRRRGTVYTGAGTRHWGGWYSGGGGGWSSGGGGGGFSGGGGSSGGGGASGSW